MRLSAILPAVYMGLAAVVQVDCEKFSCDKTHSILSHIRYADQDCHLPSKTNSPQTSDNVPESTASSAHVPSHTVTACKRTLRFRNPRFYCSENATRFHYDGEDFIKDHLEVVANMTFDTSSLITLEDKLDISGATCKLARENYGLLEDAVGYSK